MEQEIKNCWRSARFSNIADNNTPHRQTALQRLIERYKRFSRMALILAGCTPLYLFVLLRNCNTVSVWQSASVAAFMMVYCLTASAMDNWLRKGLSSIRVADMPVAEVCRRAFYYRKRHFQFMAVLIPMCLILLGWLAWLLSENEYFLYGMAVGAVIGVLAGYTVLSKFLKEYKALMSEE